MDFKISAAYSVPLVFQDFSLTAVLQSSRHEFSAAICNFVRCTNRRERVEVAFSSFRLRGRLVCAAWTRRLAAKRRQAPREMARGHDADHERVPGRAGFRTR